MQVLMNWLVATLAIMVTAYVLPGVRLAGFFPAFALAVILGLINATLRPLLLILTLPINILTLGLFTLVINGLLVLLASKIVPGFEVRSLLWAVLFSVVLSVINVAIGK